jgi:hypothetical protein
MLRGTCFQTYLGTGKGNRGSLLSSFILEKTNWSLFVFVYRASLRVDLGKERRNGRVSKLRK